MAEPMVNPTQMSVFLLIRGTTWLARGRRRRSRTSPAGRSRAGGGGDRREQVSLEPARKCANPVASSLSDKASFERLPEGQVTSPPRDQGSAGKNWARGSGLLP